MNTSADTAQEKAYQQAHDKFSLPPEERADYIRDNLQHFSTEELQELIDAMRASKAGDKHAIRRLTERKGRELAKLKKQAKGGAK